MGLKKVMLTSMFTEFVIADFDRLKKQQESKSAENQLNSYDIRVRIPDIFKFVVQRYFNPTSDFAFVLLNLIGLFPKIFIWAFSLTAKWFSKTLSLELRLNFLTISAISSRFLD